MARAVRKFELRQVPLSAVKDDLSRLLCEAEEHGTVIGFSSDDDWFDYRLESFPRFLKRIDAARKSLRAGRSVN
jgi:hypothetical protein